MTDKPLQASSDPELEDQPERPSLDPREVEVRLAIADYVIRRVAGTPAGQEIFDALISRFKGIRPANSPSELQH